MRKKILYLLFIVALLEIGARTFFCVKWDIGFFRMDKVLLHYYPELRGFEKKYAGDTSSIKILVLGGSAVNTHYSNLKKFVPQAVKEQLGHPLNITVYDLAQYGQTTMDSRVKMKYLKKYFFDYVLFYHAINDTRANNIPDSLFDTDYRHFAYYNEVFICEQHWEKKFFVLPYTIHYMTAMLGDIFNPQPRVPPYYIVKEDSVYNTTFWKEGSHIKTAVTFRKNLQTIVDMATEHKDTRVLLFTYANYTPADYSLKKFMRKELDYQEQTWPTEIYGDPVNVMKGIAVHNDISRTFKDKPGVIFVDYALMVPHTKEYFHDICHPTETACKLMSAEIARIVIADSTRRNKKK